MLKLLAFLLIICSLFMQPVPARAQSGVASQGGHRYGRHFILLIDDSGSIEPYHKSEMARSLPQLLFGGIRQSSEGKALAGFESNRDRLSVVFFTIHSSDACAGGRQTNSLLPENIFRLELSGKVGGQEDFRQKLAGWLGQPCRSSGNWSPISISQMLVLPYLQERLPKDELNSQTILIVATDGNYNVPSPSHELTDYYKVGLRDVEKAHDTFNRVSGLFATNVPRSWRKSSGSMIYLVAELRPQTVPESVLNYQTDSRLEPQAISSSEIRYALNSGLLGDIQVLLKQTNSAYTFKPLWLSVGFEENEVNEWRIGEVVMPAEAPPLDLTGCQSPTCMRRGNDLLGVSLFDAAVGRFAISPSDADPGSGKIKFRVGFHYETEVYNHLYVETEEQVINVAPPDPDAESARIPNPFLPDTRLSKRDLTSQWWPQGEDNDGVTTQEEAKNRMIATRNTRWLMAIISFGLLVGLVMLYFFLTAYHRRFDPHLKWLPAPGAVVDFNRSAASRLLVGTLKVINDQPVPRFGRLLGNKEQPTRQAEIALDYRPLDNNGLQIDGSNPIGFVIADKQDSMDGRPAAARTALRSESTTELETDSTDGRHAETGDSLERKINESVSDGKQIHVFLAAETIKDILTARAVEPEAKFPIDVNATMGWIAPGGQNGGKGSFVNRAVHQIRSWLPLDKPGSITLPVICQLTVRPEDPRKPLVTYVPSEDKLYFAKGKEVRIGKFVFESRAGHRFAETFKRGNYTIQTYRDNRPLGGEPIRLKLDNAPVKVPPKARVEIPVEILFDGQTIPNPDPVSCHYTFKLVGDFDADSSPGMHSTIIHRDPARAEIELIVTYLGSEQEIFWTPQGQAKQRLLLADGSGAEECEIEGNVISFAPLSIEFDPQLARPQNLVSFKIGNSARSGRGLVAVDIGARFVGESETLNGIRLSGSRNISDLLGVFSLNEKKGEVRVREGDEPEIRDVRIDPGMIARVISGRVEPERLSVEVALKVHLWTDQGEESRRELTIRVPVGLEQLPGLNWLAIDFGTSAIAAALGSGKDVAPIPLQEIKVDGGMSLGEYDVKNPEHDNPFLLPSLVICDADLRRTGPIDNVNIERRPGFPGYHKDDLPLIPGEAHFVGLPALMWQLKRTPGRVIYSLKSWLGKSSENVQLKTEITYSDENGVEIKNDKLPLGKAVESGLAALADAYLFDSGYRADRIVLTHPNTFTRRHKELLHEYSYRVLGKRFGIPLRERIELISESDAVAYYYCAQKMERRTPQQTERILVYDFGAGTLDLSLIRIEWKMGTVNYPIRWEVEGRIGVPVAGNYIDETLARIIDRLLRDRSLQGADCVEYQFPIVGRLRDIKDKEKHQSTIVDLWEAIREAKHQWDGSSAMNIKIGSRLSNEGVVKDVDAHRLDKEAPDRAGLWADNDYIYLSIPAREIHDNDRMSEFIEFVTTTVIDELLYAANVIRESVDTVIVSGRGALWPGLRDQVRNGFRNSHNPGLDDDSGLEDADVMKDAVVRGAIARQDLLLDPKDISYETKWRPKLGVLINNGDKLIPEEEWGNPIDLSVSPIFRIVQVNLKDPNPREDMGSLRKHFYIDLADPFRRAGVWARTRKLWIRKEERGGILGIYLEDGGKTISVPVFPEIRSAETVTMPPWPVGNFLLDPNE